MSSIEERIQELPPDLRREVDDFVTFLLAKQRECVGEAPSLTWAGSLKDLGATHTSVELQHAISDWRNAHQ
jgi:Protein of unknown function (DUF2281)